MRSPPSEAGGRRKKSCVETLEREEKVKHQTFDEVGTITQHGDVRVRRHYTNHTQRFRSAKLAPANCKRMYGGEAGTIQQTLVCELDKLQGRLLSDITFVVQMVYCPVQSIAALKAPLDDNAGVTEVVRRNLANDLAIFGLDGETEISQRLGVNPRSTAGSKQVSEAVRLGHNVAVNYLRKRLYVYAAEVLPSNQAMTPALLSSTILQRLNGVLDPEDRINGRVPLTMPEMRLPVSGIGMEDNVTAAPGAAVSTVLKSNATGPTPNSYARARKGNNIVMETTANGTPDVYALMTAQVQGMSLTAFYNAETIDGLARTARSVADQNPYFGEEAVLRWSMGLQLDTPQEPFMLYEREYTFAKARQMAMDKTGLIDETSMTGNVVTERFTVPVPATELGGIVYTFVSVKPDERIQSMPDPTLTTPWKQERNIDETLLLDPVSVSMRDLYSDIASGSENVISMWTGFNALKQSYVDYGFTRNTDLSSMDNLNAIYSIAVPASVTPSNVVYPADVPQTPWLDASGEICVLTTETVLTVRTPLPFGPTPIEEVAILDTSAILP